MKKLLFLWACLPIFFLSAQPQWYWANPQPVGNDLQAVTYSNAETAWAVGRGGSLLISADSGKSWRQYPLGSQEDFQDVFFWNDKRGWVCGSYGNVYFTESGGKGWYALPSRLEEPLMGLHFVSADTGFVIGAYGGVYFTATGGLRWELQTYDERAVFYDIFFLNRRLGWIVGSEGAVYRTIDGGRNWLAGSVPQGAYDLRSVCFVDEFRGWAVGAGGTILYSNNGGRSWTEQASGTRRNLQAIHFTNDQTGWAVGEGESLLFTQDGGELWLEVPLEIPAEAPQGLQALAFSAEGKAVLVGENGLILSARAADMDWKLGRLFTLDDLQQLSFSSVKKGWLLSRTGKLFHTQSRGKDWAPWELEGMEQAWRKVFFLNDSLGWLLGRKGELMITRDGGYRWYSRSVSSKGSRLLDISFGDARRGYICGSDGRLWVSPDGGMSWQARDLSPGQSLWRVTLSEEGDVWVAALREHVWKKASGETEFEEVSLPWEGVISDICIKQGRVWLLSLEGKVYRSRNEGAKWKASQISTAYKVTRLRFRNAKEGIALTSGPEIFYTTNGGKRWKVQPLPAGKVASDLVFQGATGLWLVGSEGMLLQGNWK